MFAKWIDAAQQFAFSETDTGGVEIAEADILALLDAERTGMVLRPDADGRPVAVERTYTEAELAAVARTKRDAALAACEWPVIRHRDQMDAGVGTTLTAAQYAELLAYRQALRDWPTVDGWPDVDMPSAPEWLA